MNESLFSSGPADIHRAGDRRARVRDTHAQPFSEKAATTATGALAHAAQAAHHIVDRVASEAAPAARQLGEAISDAQHTLHEKTDQVREARNEWIDGVRSTVRNKPLSCIAAAFALGAVVAVLSR